MLDAVLAKELERAGRFGDAVSLILFDVDRLSTINEEHGYGVGDGFSSGWAFSSGSISGSTTGWRGTRRIRSRCC